jgi:hypothetical protein
MHREALAVLQAVVVLHGGFKVLYVHLAHNLVYQVHRLGILKPAAFICSILTTKVTFFLLSSIGYNTQKWLVNLLDADRPELN